MANPRGNPQNLKAPFKKGESGNPGGKPVGAKNAVTSVFLRDLAEIYEKHGKAALEKMAIEEPSKFSQALFGLLPRDDKLTVDETVTVNDGRAAIRAKIADMLAGPDVAGSEEALSPGSDARH